MKEPVWEILGMIMGFSVSAIVAIQVCAEILDGSPSTLHPAYVGGFILPAAFWTAYGVRFSRPAIWATNAAVVLIQSALFTLVLIGF